MTRAARTVESAESARLKAEHLDEWRDAAKRAMRSYREWCASSRRDRSRLYAACYDALLREERAALLVENDSSAE
jgi:hypothetical protein